MTNTKHNEVAPSISDAFLDAMKGIYQKYEPLKVPAHYQAVFVSYPSWEETSPIFATKEEADQWLSKSMAWSGRSNDWGYVNEVILDSPAVAESEAV